MNTDYKRKGKQDTGIHENNHDKGVHEKVIYQRFIVSKLIRCLNLRFTGIRSCDNYSEAFSCFCLHGSELRDTATGAVSPFIKSCIHIYNIFSIFQYVGKVDVTATSFV